MRARLQGWTRRQTTGDVPTTALRRRWGRHAHTRRGTVAALLTTLVLAGSLVSSTTAGAAGETLTVVLTQNDGAAPFDADSAAGHDANDTNGIVRTNDNLTYNVELRVDGASSTNTTFTAALPKGVEMTQVPAFCTGAGSSLTPASLGAAMMLEPTVRRSSSTLRPNRFEMMPGWT